MVFCFIRVYKGGKYIQLIPLSTVRGSADELFNPLYCELMICFSPNWMDLHSGACHIPPSRRQSGRTLCAYPPK